MHAKKTAPGYSTVRLGGHTIRIPKKGRIRVVFFIIILFFFFRFVGAKLYSAVFFAKSSVNNKHSEEIAQRQSNAASLPSRMFSRTLTREDIASFLSKVPPDFAKTVDTVMQQNHRVLLHYTIDTSLQKLGKDLLKQYHPKYGAIVAIEPSTGRILSLVSYTNPEEPPLGSNLYCRALFPAASVFKTITAAAVLERGLLNPESTLKLVGNRYTLYRFQLQPIINGGDEVPFSKAFAQSMNPIFARIGMYMVGYSGLSEYAHKFGFSTAIPFELPVDTSRIKACDSSYAIGELACGFNRETTISPLMGSLIASAIAENGKIPVPFLVDSITDIATGASIYTSTQSTWLTPIKPQTAKKLGKLMSEVVQTGTAHKAFRLVKNSFRFNDFEYGGKTGSVDEEKLGKIDWFIGYAAHPTDPKQRIAVGIVTVHGAYWTVHSSYLAAELINRRIRTIQCANEALALQATSLQNQKPKPNG